jgi:hypothetical protein
MSASAKPRRFFFPCIGIDAPMFEKHFIMNSEWSVARRLWQTTTFDLATLASKHRLHLSWHLMEALLGGVNCELAIGGVDDYQAGREHVRLLPRRLHRVGNSGDARDRRLGLYCAVRHHYRGAAV